MENEELTPQTKIMFKLMNISRDMEKSVNILNYNFNVINELRARLDNIERKINELGDKIDKR